MAIFSKLILGSTLLSSLALAAPFGVLFDVKPAWTVYETDYTTIDVTTTIYINDATTKSSDTFKPTASTAAPLEASSSSVVSTAAPSTTMSTSVIPAAIPASVFTPSTSSVAPAVTPAPVVPTPSTTSVVAPSSSAAATPSIAGKGVTTGPSSASDSATCMGEGSACQGDITYYGGGLGACGLNVDPTGNGIALPYEFMGTASNSNPYCGKTLTIFNPATGQTAQGVVMDKCMGCTGRSIDMTETLMNSLTNGQATLLGRAHNVDWWFN